MLSNLLIRFALAGMLTLALSGLGRADDSVRWWLTSPAPANRLTPQAQALAFIPGVDPARSSIIVDARQRFQTIDGFGFALTGGSAQHLIAMSAAKRAEILNELFSTQGSGIGISYLRLSIGASDLNERVFSYNDLPEGKTDVRLEQFGLSDDLVNVVPVMKEILAINPQIKILGSPWSAPVWMKTNHKVQGGKLKVEYYPVYAQYFVKYIQAMAAQGIFIDAITVQNEPFNDGNTPSMQMFAKEQALFVKQYLGPAFRATAIRTKILLYDHNCDAPEYPVSILTDPEAYPFIDGSAFHLYAGPITAMSEVHDRFPAKNLYLTEIMAVNRSEFNAAGPVARILVGATRNWSRNVLLWNLAANAHFQPHTDNGGCAMCQGAITIEGDNVERNLAYYVIGHASKFIPDGSFRIGSTESKELPNVAFRTPAGTTVLLVANPGPQSRTFNLVADGRSVQPQLPAGAVATFVW